MRIFLSFLIALHFTNAMADTNDRWECTDSNGRTFTLSEPTRVDKCIEISHSESAKQSIRKSKADDKKNEIEAKKKGVVIGMTTYQALKSSWGKPNKVNRTTNVYGVSEQWVYGGHNYLYFKDGILTSISN